MLYEMANALDISDVTALNKTSKSAICNIYFICMFYIEYPQCKPVTLQNSKRYLLGDSIEQSSKELTLFCEQ